MLKIRSIVSALRVKARFFQHVLSTFAISILQQVFGLGRQILIAAYFGLSRDYDQYLVIYAVASILIFNLSSVFDTVALSRLVQVREAEGEALFWRSSNRLLLQALLGGILFPAGLYLAVYVLMPVIGAGFSDAERTSVMELAKYFLLWTFVIIPYYATSVHLKALWKFHWVFSAEIVVIAVSAGVLWLRHDSIASLPVAYGIGYLIAFVVLLFCRGIHRVKTNIQPVLLLGSMANQSLANQIGSLSGFADRYFQSFLQVGGISALGYAGLIVNNLSSLMTFREIYVVPLSVEVGRTERLERMLQGVVLVSIPCVLFIAEFARPIIAVLFQRGNFTPEAAILTSGVLRIMALSLLISSILAPMARIFQILGRISYSHILYFVSLIGTVSFQYVLVFRMGFGVWGVAWAALANSAVVTLVVAELIRRCDVHIRWGQVLNQAVFAIGVAVVATVLSWPFATYFSGLSALMAGGAVFGLTIATGYFLSRSRLRLIIG